MTWQLDGAGSPLTTNYNAPYYEATWDSTKASEGPHFIKATAEDSGFASGTSASGTFTVDNVPDPPGGTMHLHALEGSFVAGNRGRFDVSVTSTVFDANEVKVQNAAVSGTWGGGARGSGSCTTDAEGHCTVSKKNVRRLPVSFTVTNVELAGLTYDPNGNHGDTTTTVGP